MSILLTDNVTRNLLPELDVRVRKASDIRMAVAFVSKQGFSWIASSIEAAVDNGAAFELLVGLDMNTTEPAALKSFFNLCQHSSSASMYCQVSEDAGIFHPKLYLMRGGPQASIIVGSSNLTTGGLKRNAEVNLVVDVDEDDEIVSDAYEVYSRLKFRPGRVAPDEELLQLYEAAFRHGRRTPSVMNAAASALVAKVRTLAPPVATRRDLVGWLETVYDVLPDGEFMNSDIYRHEEVIMNKFPANRNVRAKIRQQLQFLRDMGFLDHLGRGRWRKT